MDFNDLLGRDHIDPEGVLVFRHRPKESKLEPNPRLAESVA